MGAREAAKATLEYKNGTTMRKLRRIAHQVLGDQHCRKDFREAWHDASDVVFLKSSVCCASCLDFLRRPRRKLHRGRGGASDGMLESTYFP